MAALYNVLHSSAVSSEFTSFLTKAGGRTVVMHSKNNKYERSERWGLLSSEHIWAESNTEQHVCRLMQHALPHCIISYSWPQPCLICTSTSIRRSQCFLRGMPLIREQGSNFNLGFVLIRHCQHHYMWQHCIMWPQAVFTSFTGENSFESLCDRKIFVFSGSDLYCSRTCLHVTKVQSCFCEGKQTV